MSALRILTVAIALCMCVTRAPVLSAQGPLRDPTQAQVRYGSANFRIKVPAAPKRPAVTRGIRPFYLSPSTKSFAVSTDGTSPVIANVNPSTHYASVTLRHIPVGSHTFQVTAYDRPGGTGTVLSAGNSGPVNVPPGYVNVYLTLSGVVASVALVLDYPNPTLGSPALINLNVIAKDPDGNVILPMPGYPAEPYTRPLTLTTSDPLNGKLSTTTVQESTGSANGLRVSVAYSGANVSKIVFSATGGGLTPQGVTPATLVPLVPPTSGERLIAEQLDDPVTAYSTNDSHQLLATIGPTAYYDSIAVDESTGLLYMEDQHYTKSKIDIFAAGGAYGLIDSISVPQVSFGGLTIDSVRGQLFVAEQSNKPLQIAVYSTSAGHALLGSIPNVSSLASLAVDSVGARLYAAGCTMAFACDYGFEVYSAIAPYQKLGAYGKTTFGTSYCAAAVDSVTERLFLSECNLPNENPSYVDVYEATNLNARIARIGPLTPAAQIAIDSTARVLYVTNEPVVNYTYDYDVSMYALDDGFSLLGSFPIRSVFHIAVAPYAK